MRPDDSKVSMRAEPSLTEGASEVLSAHLEVTRNRVLQEIQRICDQDGREGRVRAEDVNEAIRRLSVSDARMHYIGMLRRANRRFGYVLASLGTISALAWAATSFESNTKSWYSLALGMSIGIVGALGGDVVRAIIRRYRGDRAANSRAFLRRFIELEISARNFVAREEGTDAADGPLSLVFDTLLARKVWTEEEVNAFRLLLRLRNSLVHEQKLELSQADLRVALQQTERLRDLIPKWPGLPTFKRGQTAQTP